MYSLHLPIERENTLTEIILLKYSYLSNHKLKRTPTYMLFALTVVNEVTYVLNVFIDVRTYDYYYYQLYFGRGRTCLPPLYAWYWIPWDSYFKHRFQETHILFHKVAPPDSAHFVQAHFICSCC